MNRTINKPYPLGGRYWIQYHNYDRIGFPLQEVLDEEPNFKLSKYVHTITTRKQLIKNTKGDIIYLILGITFNKKKRYCLWSVTTVEKIKPIDKDGFYEASGDDQFYLYPPQILNDEAGFNEFFQKTGSFALGLQNVSEWEFLKTLQLFSKKFKFDNPKDITYKQFIKNFEEYLVRGT